MDDQQSIEKQNSNPINSKQSIWSKISSILIKNDKASLLNSVNSLIENCEMRGLIASEEKKMIKNIINIGDVKVDDVMTPRTDIIAIKEDSDLGQIKDLIVLKEHTRMPVYKENLDEISGFIHIKDLAKFLENGINDFKVNSIIRKILYVPNSMRVIDLLLKMRSSRVHIAVVLDEYGGTDGLVTIEDAVEEIVGEIEDEHDLPDNSIYMRIKKIDDNMLQVGGRIGIGKIEELLETKIVTDDQSQDFDTVAGLMLSELKKVPKVGELVEHSSGLSFKVLDADDRSVRLVEVAKINNSLESSRP